MYLNIFGFKIKKTTFILTFIVLELLIVAYMVIGDLKVEGRITSTAVMPLLFVPILLPLYIMAKNQEKKKRK